MGGSAEHYASAPWKPIEGDTNEWELYLRSVYWSFMTLTTTGHVDIIEREGREWEVGMALVVTFVATFIYIYVNANFTSIVLRMNSRMEAHRSRIKGVDTYLRKNKVSRELRKVRQRPFKESYKAHCSLFACTGCMKEVNAPLCVVQVVKRHFEESYKQDSDQAILDHLPHSLRREVRPRALMRPHACVDWPPLRLCRAIGYGPLPGPNGLPPASELCGLCSVL